MANDWRKIAISLIDSALVVRLIAQILALRDKDIGLSNDAAKKIVAGLGHDKAMVYHTFVREQASEF